MSHQPTRGATERAAQSWESSRILAFLIRTVAFVVPIIGSFLVVRLVNPAFFRSSGWPGTVAWLLQAFVVGVATSLVIDRWTRRLLPLATLFGMSLVFPDQAPSRFSVALRAGTIKKRIDELGEVGLGESTDEAAVRAVELVTALARHDRLTRGHTERVRAYADLIGEEMELSAEDKARLSWGVLLHDVGKLTVPAEILNKDGRPTDEEWEVLKQHPAAGGEILAPLADWLGEWVLAAAEHHERWDGTGYPLGLKGHEISLAGRITAVADAYDVITSKRSYKTGMSTAAARQELVDCAGTQFDPMVVRAFLNVAIGRRWMVGPLAPLADLPVAQISTAVTASPVITGVGAVVAAGSLAAPLGPLPETALPLQTTQTTIVAERVTVEDLPEPTSTVVTVPTSEPGRPVPTLSITDGNETTTTTVESTSSSTTTTTSTVATTTTTAPTTTTTAAPTTTAPTTTTTTAPTTTTTAAPTTTTTAPTTTTTTTTTAPTTTTTLLPPAAVYYLKNPFTGDTFTQLFKTLELDGPDDAVQPNFDTERNSDPGLELRDTSNGFDEGDIKKIQRFGMDPGGQRLIGEVTGVVYATNDEEPAGVVRLTADIADCDGFYQNCTSLASDQGRVRLTLAEGFEAIDLDFGMIDHDFDPGRRLVLRLITEDGETLHTGFDSDENPSHLKLRFE